MRAYLRWMRFQAVYLLEVRLSMDQVEVAPETLPGEARGLFPNSMQVTAGQRGYREAGWEWTLRMEVNTAVV